MTVSEEREKEGRAAPIPWNLMICPVGTSGSIMYWMIDYINKGWIQLGQLRVVPFVSELDAKFYMKNKLCRKEDIVTITSFGAGGDCKRAERSYGNQRDAFKTILDDAWPIHNVLILGFGGGGTSCGVIPQLARDLLEEHSEEGYPKILVGLKVPTHNFSPPMQRNTERLLSELSKLHEEHEAQISVVIFSDGLAEVPDRLEPFIHEYELMFPDITNIPVGDFFGTILASYAQVGGACISNFFAHATEKPGDGSYGAFGAPIAIRGQIETLKETIECKLWECLRGMADIEFDIKDRAGVYGILWAPRVDARRQRELFVEDIRHKFGEMLARYGVNDVHVWLYPLFADEARAIEILAILRGIKFKLYGKWFG